MDAIILEDRIDLPLFLGRDGFLLAPDTLERGMRIKGSYVTVDSQCFFVW